MAARTEPATCLAGGSWGPARFEPRDFETETVAEILGCGMDGEVMGRRPEVELASCRVAFEAAVAIGRQVHPEVTALGMAGLVDRARAAEPLVITATGYEAQERQDLPDRDLGSQQGKVNGWHGHGVRYSKPNREEGWVNHPLAFRQQFPAKRGVMCVQEGGGEGKCVG